VIGCFVDIGSIVDHNCLNFLFIIYDPYIEHIENISFIINSDLV